MSDEKKVPVTRHRAVLQLTLDRRTVELLDKFAKERGWSKSRVVDEAVRLMEEASW